VKTVQLIAEQLLLAQKLPVAQFRFPRRDIASCDWASTRPSMCRLDGSGPSVSEAGDVSQT
jgi:hypothetical protein